VWLLKAIKGIMMHFEGQRYLSRSPISLSFLILRFVFLPLGKDTFLLLQLQQTLGKKKQQIPLALRKQQKFLSASQLARLIQGLVHSSFAININIKMKMLLKMLLLISRETIQKQRQASNVTEMRMT